MAEQRIYQTEKVSMGEVDIVVPWVDGGDPNWLAVKSQYEHTATDASDNGEARYRDWDIFHYWFRSIEKYAPWVNKVFLVTWGHVPSWLNINHPKIVVVRHDEYIPREYLPTFNSHTIELNLHRINGLSEKFVYFNDDVYLTKPTTQKDFFQNNIPCDAACLGQIRNRDTVSFMPYFMLNMMGMLNETFSKPKVIRKHPSKWFNIKYGRGLLMNIYLSPYNFFTGFKAFHIYQPLLKSSFYQAWEKYHDALDATCRSKFREKDQVNIYLIRYWQLLNGNFHPVRLGGNYLTISNENLSDIERTLLDPKHLACCINDDPNDYDFAQMKKQLTNIFDRAFPLPSTFEN